MPTATISQVRVEGERGQALSQGEHKDLDRLERRVRDNLAGFIEAGRALMEINDRQLYRAEFPTFQAYCHERFGMSRAYAYRIIRAVEVADNLSPRGDISGLTEKQARVLAPLTAEEQIAVWKEATADGHSPTARELADWRSRTAEELAEDVRREEAEALSEGKSDGGQRERPAPKERDRKGGTRSLCGRAERLARDYQRAFDAIPDASDEQAERFRACLAGAATVVDELRGSAAD